MRTLLSLALLLALPLSAADRPATISLTPSTPKAGDSVVVTVHGIWTDGCLPALKSSALDGRTLRIEAAAPSPCPPCPAAVLPYAITVPAVVLADAVPYTIEYAVTECFGTRTVLATKGIVPTPSCAFDRSLTVTRSGLLGLSWCDPSFSAFPDTGLSATAYRVFVVREGEAPILVHEQSAAAGTRANIALTATEAAARDIFVEAAMCQVTIAGCRGEELVLKSNVEPLLGPADEACSFGGAALCLGGRFSVTARFGTATASSAAHPVPMTKDTGNFWFFSPNNVELVVKMVDACSTPTPRFWFFAAGLTDLGVELVVRDVKTGVVRRYSSAPGTPFAPIQDTNAFATCTQ